MTTCSAAIRNILAAAAKAEHLGTISQSTRVDLAEGNEFGDDACHGEVRAILDIDKMAISLSWDGDDGSDDMPHEVYSDLESHSDTDEIEDAIREAFGEDVDVKIALNWSETSARVVVTVESWTDEPSMDERIGLIASSDSDEVEHRDSGSRVRIALSQYVDAVAAGDGQMVTGYDEPGAHGGCSSQAVYDRANAAALVAARALVEALGVA